MIELADLRAQYESVRGDIDRAISRINDRSRCRLGFNSNGNHNGHKPSQIAITGGRR